MKGYTAHLGRLLLILLLIASLAQATDQPWSTTQERRRVFDAVVEVFQRNYWDAEFRDWQSWAAAYREEALTASSRAAFDRVLSRMVRELGDDHSTWLGLISYADEGELPGPSRPMLGFSARLLQGIGVVVERVFPGGAAAEAGLRRGDVIVSVDGRELSEQAASGLVWTWLGAAAQQPRVTLEVLRGGTLMERTLEPTPLRVGEADQLPQAEMLDERLGYLYLPSFNRADIASEVHRLVAELQGQGLAELVVDLRGNPGGRITELGLVLGVFIDGVWGRAVSDGEVVWQGHYRTQGGRGTAWLEDPSGDVLLRRQLDEPVGFSGPLAVLVDRRNSSAGELAAMVLQDRGRAQVVGEPTSGNVEAIRGFDLPDGSVVMVAVANVEGADGRSFSSGVVPDRVASESLAELAQGYDAPLAEAIRLLRGLPFTPNRFFGQIVTDQGAEDADRVR